MLKVGIGQVHHFKVYVKNSRIQQTALQKIDLVQMVNAQRYLLMKCCLPTKYVYVFRTLSLFDQNMHIKLFIGCFRKVQGLV